MTANVSQVFQKMVEHESGIPHRVAHFAKVYAYAKAIGELEGLPERMQNILEVAAVMHDVGIRPSEEKRGCCYGYYQQIDGPAPARAILEALGQDEALIERVCWLIAHHHTFTNVDGPDHRILLEADFLVNIFEGGFSRKQVDNIRRNVFRTQSGLMFLQHMFYNRQAE